MATYSTESVHGLNGILVSVEGLDGAGKTTQLAAIRSYFEKFGFEVVDTVGLGGTPAAIRLRNSILKAAAEEEVDLLCETLSLMAAMSDNIHKTIIPALTAGKVVISDRYIDATAAFQGAGRRGLTRPHQHYDMFRSLVESVVDIIWPDFTLVLDIDPQLAYERRRARGKPEGPFERLGMEFHTRMREYYRACCDTFIAPYPSRFHLVDASQTEEEVTQDVQLSLDQWLGRHRFSDFAQDRIMGYIADRNSGRVK